MIFFAPLQTNQQDQQLLNECASELEEIWDTYMSDPDLDTYACSREDLLQAIRQAPDEVTRQILYADFRFREWISMAIGVRQNQ